MLPGEITAILISYHSSGVSGLDGIHPNELGQAVIANELIKAINAHYGFNYDLIDEFQVWKRDSLNQDPVDIEDYVHMTADDLECLGGCPEQLLGPAIREGIRKKMDEVPEPIYCWPDSLCYVEE